jgi:hypothetical protein
MTLSIAQRPREKKDENFGGFALVIFLQRVNRANITSLTTYQVFEKILEDGSF